MRTTLLTLIAITLFSTVRAEPRLTMYLEPLGLMNMYYLVLENEGATESTNLRFRATGDIHIFKTEPDHISLQESIPYIDDGFPLLLAGETYKYYIGYLFENVEEKLEKLKQTPWQVEVTYEDPQGLTHTALLIVEVKELETKEE